MFSFLSFSTPFWDGLQNLFVYFSISALGACDQCQTYQYDMPRVFRPYDLDRDK